MMITMLVMRCIAAKPFIKRFSGSGEVLSDVPVYRQAWREPFFLGFSCVR
jgi:hypothetical protein